MRPSGGVDTILLDDRYAPYEKQRARIENLCGSFTERVCTSGLLPVLSRSGMQHELYHQDGNVTISQGKGSFLAVRCYEGIVSLAHALQLETPRNTVHMVVITSRTGRRAQVCNAGLLEASLARHKTLVRVSGRIYEHTNSVAFSVRRYPHPLAHAPRQSLTLFPQLRQPPILHARAYPPRQQRLDCDGQRDGHHALGLETAGVDTGG